MNGIDLRPANAGLFSHHHVPSGQALFHQGDPFRQLHAVRHGSFKLILTLPDGREQVCGFRFPSEMVGSDGIGSNRHGVTVQALESAQTCAFSYAALMVRAGKSWGIVHGLHRSLGSELARGKSHAWLLANLDARQRMAKFLLDLSGRAVARGQSPSDLQLPMTRADIGSYLGMTLETVSRALSTLRRSGHLDVELRHIRITDHAGLLRSVAA